jgi:paraquat-inducible protein A
MTFDAQLLAPIFSRSRARAAAFAVGAAVMLVPANLLPVLSLESPGSSRTDTIYSGIVGLIQQGLWPLGAIVFTASFLVPLLKLAGIAWLLVATHRPVRGRARTLTRLYAALDFIGRWSMLDVFLVAFLSGAVRFGVFATVQPRAGIIAFAAAVVLTMLATAAFDPRLLWNLKAQRQEDTAP